jgi:hypothetical protein
MSDSISISSWDDLSVAQWTNLLVFGWASPPEDYDDRIRASTDEGAVVTIATSGYMTDGPGKYAYPARAAGIAAFFDSLVLSDGDYTVAQIKSELQTQLGFTTDQANAAFAFTLDQIHTDVDSSDYLPRAYVFGHSTFAVGFDDSTPFHVSSGTKSITGLEILPGPDNFDFESTPGSMGQFVDDYYLLPGYDPYNLERLDFVGDSHKPVHINFSGGPFEIGSYSSTNYSTHAANISGVTATNT